MLQNVLSFGGIKVNNKERVVWFANRSFLLCFALVGFMRANSVRPYGEWRGNRRAGACSRRNVGEGLPLPKRDSYSLKLVVSQGKPCSRDCAQNAIREESLTARYNFPKGNCDILFKQCDMPIRARYVRMANVENNLSVTCGDSSLCTREPLRANSVRPYGEWCGNRRAGACSR